MLPKDLRKKKSGGLKAFEESKKKQQKTKGFYLLGRPEEHKRIKRFCFENEISMARFMINSTLKRIDGIEKGEEGDKEWEI